VIFLAFATGGVSFIKMFGVGLTLAVLIDAFLIRGTLVPAFMRLAGDWNWWAPRPLRRFHDRFGISETVDLALDEDLDVDLDEAPVPQPPARLDGEARDPGDVTGELTRR
jgi:RND superfamily putative drug exporter